MIRTLFGSVAQAAARAESWRDSMHWPTMRYANDPIGFARDILGIDPWERQQEILLSIRDNVQTAVSSGHKCSKSNTAAIAGLWFYDSFEDARVVATCVTARQIDLILYREVKKLVARSGLCLPCRKESDERRAKGLPELPKPCAHSCIITDVPGQLARTGLSGDAFRELKGFTAKEPEAIAGTSGKHLLYLVDEASGVPDEIFEAISGNMAGGGKLALFSNPTQTSGEFFEAFHGKKAPFYHTIRVSSEDTPNAKTGREIIPGLAGREWVERKKAEWGVDSALYKIRVKGEHSLSDSSKIIGVHLLTEAQDRYVETPSTGRLHIGVDTAGESGDGDEIVLCARRGKKALEFIPFRGLTADGVLTQILGTIRTHKTPRDDQIIVTFDELGPDGVKLGRAIRSYLEDHPDEFLAFGIRGSDIGRDPRSYWKMRDELWASCRDWLKNGGAIPPDEADGGLAKELNAPAWEIRITGQAQATEKDNLRKILGRSPDRADALCLAVWEPSVFEAPPRKNHSRLDPYPGSSDSDDPSEDLVYGASGGDPVYG